MFPSLTLALAQFNSTVGDITGNADAILKQYTQATANGAKLVVFPELALIGYPPEDLVLMPDFCSKAMKLLQTLAAQTNDTALVVGSLWEENHEVFNAAIVMQGGKIVHVQKKNNLPNYGVFDEKRIFSAGQGASVIIIHGVKIGVLVCEDIWNPLLAQELGRQGAKLLVSLNASPFSLGKLRARKTVTAAAAGAAGVPVVYVNAVGGQDDLVFDGGSFVITPKGETTLQLPEFTEHVSIINNSLPTANCQLLSDEETLWQAMMLGLSDYVRKNGFSTVVLGLSGGIDSALTAAVAVDALGAGQVKGVLLPSPYTSKESVEDAQALANNLGIETLTISITDGMASFEKALSPIFNQQGWMEDVAVGGNVQARLRGLTLMALSNRYGWMLLSTGNKSEIAVGYSTLYGDSCGSFNVLKDLYKTQVYALAEWRNSKGVVIPLRSITKAPSAELKPNQKDQDQLPPYDMLDAILEHHIECRLSEDAIVEEGFPREVVAKVLRMVRLSEYKRRQSCPGVKLSSMLFGRDRRYPLTNGFK